MTTQEFIVKMTSENEKLIAKLQTVKAPEEAYAVAQAEGLADSFEDFVAGMTKFHESIKDLSDSDIEMVAGGASSEEVSIIVVATLTAASALTVAVGLAV
jgi:hypothetical protein